MHIFDGQTLPTGTCTFQLCDITDPLIRSYIDDPIHRTDNVHVRTYAPKAPQICVQKLMKCPGVTGAERLVRPRHDGANSAPCEAEAGKTD